MGNVLGAGTTTSDILYRVAAKYVFAWFEKDVLLREYLKDKSEDIFKTNRTKLKALTYYDRQDTPAMLTPVSLRKRRSNKVPALRQPRVESEEETIESEEEEIVESSEDPESEESEEELPENDLMKMYYVYGNISSTKG